MIWSPGNTLEEMKFEVLRAALEHYDGNRTHASKALGISIRTLRNYIVKYPHLRYVRAKPPIQKDSEIRV